jgi:hypothetical protein
MLALDLVQGDYLLSISPSLFVFVVSLSNSLCLAPSLLPSLTPQQTIVDYQQNLDSEADKMIVAGDLKDLLCGIGEEIG